ncbi:hypothetical protein OAN307_c35400 [Octadecabacter antarcticus 307]|uniref:Uncharacterized protein n=1 Tax=Octadecabacter antarcticus 307 TaxID=391626 RepID=M9RB89_9RHOB|nr:hypothetical protein OAN307_c35400 [Octadecabacter antarcticus 307]
MNTADLWWFVVIPVFTIAALYPLADTNIPNQVTTPFALLDQHEFLIFDLSTIFTTFALFKCVAGCV